MIKSPLNYIGGKHKLLPQILPLFPCRINHFVDLFAGGLDVSLNVNANQITSNDINGYVIDIFEYFKQQEIEDLIIKIRQVIEEYDLSKTNRKGYDNLREQYNLQHNPLYLFVLICYGFNHQIRFNNNGEFNNPFGINRSSYNPRIEKNLRAMHPKLANMIFTKSNFHDFIIDGLRPDDLLYADPPYLITCGSYNDGKRGFEGWSQEDDFALFALLDELNRRDIHFAMSNVTQHKGQENKALIDWAHQYQVHKIESNYNNCNYQTGKSETVEVLITNY